MDSKSKTDNPRLGDGASPGKIFIGGLPKDTHYNAFTKHFGKYGEITDSVIMKDRQTGQPRGFGFITYADPSVVDQVIEDSHIFNGKQVEIKRTIPKGSAQSKDFKTKKIFVGGIPSTVSEDELKNFFSKYGNVVEHQIICDHETNRSRGFGFVIFDSDEVVDELLSNGKMIDMAGTQGQFLSVHFSFELMAKKKQSESVPTSSGRELRQRKSTTGGEKVDGKDKGKMPVEVKEKAKGNKSGAKESLKINETGNGENAGKRKVITHELNAEVSGSSLKRIKNTNKNEKEKGDVRGCTRVLRSQTPRKGEEGLNEKASGKEKKSDAGKKIVKKDTSAKAKTDKDIVEANVSSASTSSKSLQLRQGIAEKKGKQVQKDLEPTRKVVTRSQEKCHLELQKDLKGKKIVKREVAVEETDSDSDNPISKICIRSPKPKKVPVTSERITRKGGKSKGDQSVENAEEMFPEAKQSQNKFQSHKPRKKEVEVRAVLRSGKIQ